MTKDTLPPTIPVTGPRKRNLSERAKQAAEVQPRKKAKTMEGSRATAGKGIQNTANTGNPSAPRKRAVSIEIIEDEDDLRRSPPPRNPAHILEGPGDEDDDEIVVSQPKRNKTSRASQQNPTSKSPAPRRTPVSIEIVEDEDDLRQSPAPRNPAHILEGPDEDGDSDAMEVDVPEEPEESAEAELSKSDIIVLVFIKLTLYTQNGSPKNGHPLFMSSFAPLLASSTLRVVVFTFSSVARNIARGSMGEMCAGFWTKEMRSRRVVCIDMPRTVGERKP
jgi:hypothetical protein